MIIVICSPVRIIVHKVLIECFRGCLISHVAVIIVIDCVNQKTHFGVFNKLSVRDIKAIWDIVCVYKVQIVEGHLQTVSECRSVLPPIACPVIFTPYMDIDR